MRVAYVCADAGVPVFGGKGCSIHVQEVVRALLRRGIEVELHAARIGGSPPPGLSGVPVFRFGAASAAGPAGREGAALAANRDLTASLASRPAYAAVYERHALFADAAMHFARERGIPGILEVNAPLVEEQSLHRTLIDRDAAERRAASALGAASLVVAVSSEVADRVVREPAARRDVCVVANGVDVQRFAAAARATRDGPFTVAFLGSLRPWHGLALLAEAFALLRRRGPESRLLVVGDGPGRADLERDLERRGALEATRFVGRVPAAEVADWLGRAQVGVAPYSKSADFYFSPLKVFEYMAAGLPTVATAVGQLRQLIADGADGLLCPPGDAAAFAAALDRLRLDPALGRELGARARETALREHTWDAVVATVLERAGLEAAPLARLQQA